MDTTGLTRVRHDIAAAAGRAGVSKRSVSLVVVSKGRSSADVVMIAMAGADAMGENRQQGLKDRLITDDLRDIEWHFIGPLQSRKASYVNANVSLLHSMDRMSLAHKWVSSGATPVLVQFNLAAESQKSGFDPDDSEQVMDDLLEIGLDVRGVMAIPPHVQNPDKTRRHFARLRAIFDDYAALYGNMEHCSMGMSHDFTVAIEEGSTMVRVGRAIFEPTQH